MLRRNKVRGLFAHLVNSVAYWWRGDAVEVLPPIQARRRMAEPKQPHHRRTAELRAVIEAAPPGLSARQIVAHVRAVTGCGCSLRAVVRHRQQPVIVLAFVLAGLSGCGSPARQAVPDAPTLRQGDSTSVVILSEGAPATKDDGRPRALRLRLTLSRPDDLRVKAGEKIEAGAALCDRSAERSRLVAQRHALRLALRRLNEQARAAGEGLRLLADLGPELPTASFAAESAAIRRAEVEAASAARRVELQRRQGAALAAAPADFDREAIAQHEAARLALLSDAQAQAGAEVGLQQARLESAREVRAFDEKRARVEHARQMLAARSQLQQTEIARAQMAAQLAALDVQLERLAVVRAPFAGRVTRIEWEEGNNAEFSVVVYLAVDGR